MFVSVIAAVARNRVIGVENRLPWRLPADLRRFRSLTWGKPVVMGRLTHESIGRPLPGRRNIVVTRTGSVMGGCERAMSFRDALALTAAAPETVVIGGARCYREALPLSRRMYLTRIDEDFEGDAWFPEWNPADWTECERERFAPGRLRRSATSSRPRAALHGTHFPALKLERGQTPAPDAPGVTCRTSSRFAVCGSRLKVAQ